VLDFFKVALFGIIIGLAIAHIIYLIHRFLPTTPSIDTAISLISPYLMYLTAEHFHDSGVLAVVSGGLFLSFRSQDIYSYSSRLQSSSVWNTLVFMLNGVVFILIGLQLPFIIQGLGKDFLPRATMYGVVISLLTIIIRILWVFPSAYLPRILSSRIRKRESNPGWKSVFVVAWSGMRGVVSLAAALAVPITLSNGNAFPHRNLILYITFIVILFTLVLQGLSLPLVVRLLKIKIPDDHKQHDRAIRLRMANVTLDFIRTQYASESNNIDAFSRVKDRYERMAKIAGEFLDEDEKVEKFATFLPRYRKMLLEMVAVRRNELAKMRRENEFSEELLREKEMELDLEEARLRHN
ncbi:MAG TPA: cation:proton antiporter, partial [Puia sp.]|nr:cation:proton antiporter [Puia sp.]